MISFTYFFLLVLMLTTLYVSGIKLQRNYRIISKAGLAAILAYTLNEGLRFGRGVDFNLYGKGYEQLASGYDINTNVGFLFIEKLLVEFGIPYQGLVLLLSFAFIIGLLHLMKYYQEIVAFALPFFVILSMSSVENMVRWYLAFSFFMIGLSYMMKKGRGLNGKYFLFSFVASTIHYAFLPIPILFYFAYKFKKPFLSPWISIPLFFVIAFTFETSFMLRFVDLANMLAATSEKFEHYGNKTEYWLTAGYSGRTKNAFPGISEVVFLCIIIWYGYKVVKNAGRNYVFAYNLFLIGFLVKPIANQIELIQRFDAVMFFFRAIVLALLIKAIYVKKSLRLLPVVQMALTFVFCFYGCNQLSAPFKRNEKLNLYVWNRGNQNYDKMIEVWMDESYKKSVKLEKKKKK